jgi:hypothetical protein
MLLKAVAVLSRLLQVVTLHNDFFVTPASPSWLPTRPILSALHPQARSGHGQGTTVGAPPTATGPPATSYSKARPAVTAAGKDKPTAPAVQVPRIGPSSASAVAAAAPRAAAPRVARTNTADLSHREVTITEFELEQLIAVVDENNNGTLEIQELIEMLDYIGEPDPEECCCCFFLVFSMLCATVVFDVYCGRRR